MEKVTCIVCEKPILVTDEQRKKYGAFACGDDYDRARNNIVRQMPEAERNFFPGAVEVNINGRLCGVSRVRVI